MKFTALKNKSKLIFFSIFMLILTLSINGYSFSPILADVTTKQVSFVWCNPTAYTTCDIELYLNSNKINLTPDQKIIETNTDTNNPNNPGAAGKPFGLGKITVTGLDVDKVYTYNLKVNNSVVKSGSFTTQRLRGFDPNSTGINSDITSNDIVHKSVYKTNGTSPALGVLVLAEICKTYNKNILMSSYPITGWVGENMIRNIVSTSYDPNDPNTVSYQQYAPLNLNNLFGIDRYPLSIEGDQNETVKFTILHGTQTVLGSITGSDNFVSYGNIESIDRIGNEKVSAPKICSNFKFSVGFNPLTVPFSIPEPFLASALSDKIRAVISPGVLKALHVFVDGRFQPVVRRPNGTYINGTFIIGPGDGCIAEMQPPSPDDKELSIYGYPTLLTIDLEEGYNVFAIPQCPVGYTTSQLWLDIEKLPGIKAVKGVWTFIGTWPATIKRPNGTFINSLQMTSERICAVKVELVSTDPGATVPFCPISE